MIVVVMIAAVFYFEGSMIINGLDLIQATGDMTQGNNMLSTSPSASSPSSSSSGGRFRDRRSAIIEENMTWTNGEVPFYFSDAIDKTLKENILKSMYSFHNRTCIVFIEKTREQLEVDGKIINHVEFVKNRFNCHSDVGMKGGRQAVHVSDRCAGPDSIIHELGHLLGLWHEQARADRDAHILIKWNHMNLSMEHNFIRRDNMKWLGPYDFSSIMHYHDKMFSNDGSPHKVFKPIHDLGIPIGHKMDLSFYDALKLNKLYKCSKHCDEKQFECYNGGYLDRFCKCICPKSLTGDRCELPEYTASCGNVIELKSAKETVTSPAHPSNYPPNTNCTWLIKAPPKFQVFLTLEKYDVACNDTLEIRYHYIGNEQIPRTCISNVRSDSRSFTSTTNLLLLNFRSDTIGEGTGFRAAVKAVPSPDCASNPCKNDAKCEDKTEIETYFCKCQTGWAGKDCDIETKDAYWAPWEAWSGCSAECGYEERKRDCQEPLNSGKDCPKDQPGKETKRCSQQITKCQGLFHCDFGTSPKPNICGILQGSLNGSFNWTVRHFTGEYRRDPHGHTSGEANDNYFIMDGSNGRPYNYSTFSLPHHHVTTGRYCLQFFHHMSGLYVGMLRVIRQTKKSTRIVWQTSGTKPTGWERTNINILLHDGVKIHFHGTLGDGADSDIAVDDISLSPYGCYTPGTKSLRPNPRIHKRIHTCKKGQSSIRLGTNVTYCRDGVEHICFCNLNGHLDCMTKLVKKCKHP